MQKTQKREKKHTKTKTKNRYRSSAIAEIPTDTVLPICLSF